MVLKRLLIKLIKIYRNSLSHIMLYRCKFYPTCSQYMIDAIEDRGALSGVLCGLKRIMRCNPFSHGGYDPYKCREEAR